MTAGRRRKSDSTVRALVDRESAAGRVNVVRDVERVVAMVVAAAVAGGRPARRRRSAHTRTGSTQRHFDLRRRLRPQAFRHVQARCARQLGGWLAGRAAGRVSDCRAAAALLGLPLMRVGAIVGGVKGANEAQTRGRGRPDARLPAYWRSSDTDFTELLRARLAASKAAGDVEIVASRDGSADGAVGGRTNGATGAGSLPRDRIPAWASTREHLVNPAGRHHRAGAGRRSVDLTASR